jgi:hypothetical protein
MLPTLFRLTSLDGFAAHAGSDRTIEVGEAALLVGNASLAVPPYSCEWFADGVSVSTSCSAEVSPDADTTSMLVVDRRRG